jgi:hypothetical protein
MKRANRRFVLISRRHFKLADNPQTTVVAAGLDAPAFKSKGRHNTSNPIFPLRHLSPANWLHRLRWLPTMGFGIGSGASSAPKCGLTESLAIGFDSFFPSCQETCGRSVWPENVWIFFMERVKGGLHLSVEILVPPFAGVLVSLLSNS